MPPPAEADASFQRIKDTALAIITGQPFSTKPSHHINSETAIPNVLCESCTQVLDVINNNIITAAANTGIVKAESIALSHRYVGLQRSADLGCHLCSIFEMRALRRRDSQDVFPGNARASGNGVYDGYLYLYTVGEWVDRPMCRMYMRVIWRVEDTVMITRDPGPWIFEKVEPSKDVIDADGNHGSVDDVPLAFDTGHEQVLDKAAGWLRKCRKEHGECRAITTPEPGVPRRLLRLGDTHAHIVECTAPYEYLYTCLSHCWGSQENVPQQLFQSGPQRPFLIASLPKTFREAMSVTKRLGFEYIWIDCFCIVQASKQDWLEQSKVMAQIYANSVLTIAALSSSDVLGGCFKTRNPLANHTLIARGLSVSSEHKMAICDLEIDGEIERKSPLQTRGWVVQERLSARRTLFFGRVGIYWECKTIRTCENAERSFAEWSGKNVKSMLAELESLALQEQSSRLHLQDESISSHKAEAMYSGGATFHSTWTKLLEIYTECNLTYASDKLIALSGITNDISKRTGKSYIHGLWADNLAESLLWFHNFESVMAFRILEGGRLPSDTCIFPSWSWASMQGTIEHRLVFGRIIWQVSVAIDDRDTTRMRLTTWVREVEVNEDNELLVLDDGSGRGDMDEGYMWYSDDMEPASGRRWIVLILRVSVSEDTPRGVNWCLVVQRVSDGVYTRVGMTGIRFGTVREDVFSRDEPDAVRDHIVLI